MMDIGSTLKGFRTELGLTQKEFVGQIVSHSFYSKVESGEHQIRAQDLFDLLSSHRIPFQRFYQQLTQQSEEHHRLKLLEKRIMLASYSHDSHQFPLIIKDIETASLDPKQKEIIMAQTKLVWANVAQNSDIISHKEKQALRDYLLSKEEWGDDWLALLSNSLSIFDVSDIGLIVGMILTKELKTPEEVGLDQLLLLYSLCINFCYKCLREDMPQLCQIPLKHLQAMPDHFYFILHRAHTKCIECVMDYIGMGDSLVLKEITHIAQMFDVLGLDDTADVFRGLMREFE